MEPDHAAAPRPVERGAVEPRPLETRPLDGAVETRPLDGAVEPRPFEPRPFETRPFDPRPFETRPFDPRGAGYSSRDRRAARNRPAGIDRVAAPLIEGCPGDGLDALVADLAARAGVAAPRAAVAPTASVAYVRRGRRGAVLVIDPSVVAAGTRVLRGVVAHEIGHLAAGHQADARRRLLTMVTFAAAAGAGALGASGSPLAAACAALLVSAFGVLAVLGALRRHELAADAMAVGLLGGPHSTLETLAWLEATHPRPRRRPARLARLLDDHPTRSARQVAVERHSLAQIGSAPPPGGRGAVAGRGGRSGGPLARDERPGQSVRRAGPTRTGPGAGVSGAGHTSRPPRCEKF
jgi:hypothetical protein